MTLDKGSLAELVRAGAVADIFQAERAYAVLKVIGENAGPINASERNFGEVFGVLQGHAQNDALLAVARLYDRRKDGYATRCLRALLDDLEFNAEGLPPIAERDNLAKELVRQGMNEDTVALLNSGPDAEVARAMVAFYRDRLVKPDVVDTIKRLKAVRDKRIAHNEAHPVEGPTWNAVLHLLSIAKDIVGAVGWAYLGTVYNHDGNYTLSSDAQRSGSAMRRMLKALGIV